MKTSLRILNLEDNEADAELNKAMITARWPHSELVRVDTRADYVAQLEGNEFDLIFSDYTMPGFDGREALFIAREKRPEIPFLFVSGTIGEDIAIEALKNGATDYVLKHRLMRLIPAVDRALRESEERSERDRAERAMRESEHKYREVFECLADAAFLADAKTGKIIDTNRCAESMLGCTRSEILGRKVSHLLAVLDKAGADDSAPFECAMTLANGSARPVRVHTTKLTLHGRPLVLRLCRELDGH
ncbi:MAG TPA: response regulator [Candidatus Acidoferrales bacterium]|nr:response regulator [Candidatus Acidoferrales bacterium]